MKKTFFLSVMLLVTLIAKAQDLTQKAAQAFFERDYYTLSELCQNHADEIDPVLLAISRPVVALAFNKHEEAVSDFNTLLNEHANDIGFDNMMQMAYLTCRNFEVMQKYEAAADVCRQIVEIVEGLDEVPNEVADSFRENLQRFTELAKYPVMTIDEKSDGWTIPFSIERKELPKPSARISIASSEWAHLDASYYTAHQAELDAITEVEEDHSAGIGGVTVENKTVLRDFALNVGGKEYIIPKILASKQTGNQASIAINALGALFFCNQHKVTISIPYSKIVIE